MARVRFAVDTSAFARSSRPAVAEVLGPLAAGGELGLTGPVTFELGYSARNEADRERLVEGLNAFAYLDTVEADCRRALEVQDILAGRSMHRALSLVDALLAATAERVGLSVLHYDRDFERVAEVTGQRHQWVAPRGSVD